jgi:type II secretory pathway pseudopilin PulG
MRNAKGEMRHSASNGWGSLPMLRMVRPTHATIPARRPAFTLLELTLVLALAVILVALAWPSLERPFSTHRLRIAADTVRGLWTSTRVDAMDSGEVLIFRYAPGSNRYRIERQQADDGSSSTTSGSGGSGASAGTTNGGDPLPSRVARLPREATLPEGISFASSDVTATDQQTDPTQQLPSTIDGTTKTDNNWSQPILFYIDGTCSNARLVLKNDRDFSIEIALRGLTGVTTVSEVSKGEPGKKG